MTMQTKTLKYAAIGLCVLFIGFVWWVYLSSAGTLSLWVPVLGTLLPLAIAAGVWSVQLWAARRGEQKLEHALADDSTRERQVAGAARGAEIDRLRSEFERAVKALKTSKLAQGSRAASSALYRLPWYAIIGPPASGKTTVLCNSGLKFPYLPGTGDRLKGVGGTRNCDWWLTNQAILLDTAGRWSIEEDERDEWLAFLDLLKKHRGDRPLNGIIAAISIAGDDATSISAASEHDLREIALRMRERLDEITGRLGVALPVYLMFTKCDLIRGFVETFGALSGEQRKQIWGFTASLLQSARRDPGSYFAQQFELLRDELERRACGRMADEVNPQTIPSIYEFPAQFGALKDKLTFFVDELFDASAYRETPLLRGAYFTSGTQEGAPADLLYEEIAGALELRPTDHESRDEKKSYFLHDMLMRVVFEDRALATTASHELVRQHWKRRLLTSSLFAGSALLTTLATDSCQHNLQAIAHTEASLAHSQRARKALQTPALLTLEQDVAGYQRGGRGLADLGLYQGEQVAPALERYYQNVLTDTLVRPLLGRNQTTLLTRTQQLQANADAGGEAELEDGAREDLRDALGLQLLLTGPREACTPEAIARKELVTQRMLALWQAAEPARDGADSARKQLLTRYLELASEPASSLTLEHDARAISRARRALGDDDVVSRVLQRVISSYREPRTLAQLAGASTSLQARTTVAGAFGRDAWTKISRDIDAEDFQESEGDWVFGCSSERRDSARAELDVEAFRQAYFKRYESSWRELLAGLSAKKPATLVEAEAALGEFLTRPGVLGTLQQNVRDHTSLRAPKREVLPTLDEAGAKLGAALEAVKQEGGAKQALAKQLSEGNVAEPELVEPLHQTFVDFASFDLEPYRRLLEPVMAALKAYRQDESKVDALASAAQTARDSTLNLLRGQSPQLSPLLEPVLAGIVELTQRGRGDQLGRTYCDAIQAPFQRELAGRYPFKPDSSDAASMSAFARFFQPGSGAIWAFQQAHLGGYVSSEGGRFRFTGAHARELFRDELLDFLQRSAAISQAFFPDASAGPRMPFKIRVRGAPGYSSTTFRVGKRAVEYDSGAESWVQVEWPGSDPESAGVALSVMPYQGPGPRPLAIDNPWGLFMILQPRMGAQYFEQSNKQLSVGWRPKAGQNYVKVDFASDDPRSPLWSVPFGGQNSKLFPYNVPARITQLGAACGSGGR
jgi:type VI secretion system protein ImpL